MISFQDSCRIRLIIHIILTVVTMVFENMSSVFKCITCTVLCIDNPVWRLCYICRLVLRTTAVLSTVLSIRSNHTSYNQIVNKSQWQTLSCMIYMYRCIVQLSFFNAQQNVFQYYMYNKSYSTRILKWYHIWDNRTVFATINNVHVIHLNTLLIFPNTIVSTDNWITSFSGLVMTNNSIFNMPSERFR
jgi:hypothetical protein